MLWVEWGGAIWQIAFVVSVISGATWNWWSPRRHAKREARNWIVRTTPIERFEEGANTIVEGTLQGGRDSVLVDGATIATIQGLASSAIDQVSIAVCIDDEVVELRGPMALMLGSEELRPRGTFHRDGALHARVCALPDGPLAAGQLEGQPYVIRWLRSGDRVQARGVLRRSAAQSESSYRETQGRWVLCGSDPRPLTLGSAARPHIVQKDIERLAIGATMGGLAFAGVFIGVGALLHHSMPPEPSMDVETVATILTATPLHREDGVEALREIWHAEPDEAALTRLAALIGAEDGCHGAAMLWETHGQTQRAIEAADECDHPAARLAAARAHYARGDMTEASRALQNVRDELDLAYAPIQARRTSRVRHAIGATRAHLARARWRNAARELDAAWSSNISCVADVARRRAGLTTLVSETGEPCLILEASEDVSRHRRILETFQHASIAHLLLREASPTAVLASRRPHPPRGDTLGVDEMQLGIPTDPTCPIDPRGAPGLERAVLDELLDQETDEETDDPLTRRLVATLAARRALIEMLDGRPGRAAEHAAIMQRAGRIAEHDRFSEMLELWNARSDRAPLPDSSAMAAWNDPDHDRNQLLRFRATTDAGRALIIYGHDRPMLSTFREHFCDAAARGLAARRAGLPDVAREQRAVAHRFRELLEGRRASIMLWVLDRRAD